LEELCGAPSPAAPSRVDRGLAATAAVVLGLGSLTLLAPAIPAAASAIGDSIRTIWFDPFWKQTTGFTLGALILLAFALSARKRIRRFAFGAYAKWRVIHALLGAAGAVALFAHTGFRLGSQLNLVLMLVFLASLLSGAVSGVLVAIAARGANSALQRGVAITKRMHDFSFWALPVLVAFHVFKTYYY
jgi:nitrite reductase (NADH) large subunit